MNLLIKCVTKNYPDYNNFLFDGSNFRGYHAESELIAKAYVNDWCAGITADVWAEEDENYLLKSMILLKQSHRIKI